MNRIKKFCKKIAKIYMGFSPSKRFFIALTALFLLDAGVYLFRETYALASYYHNREIYKTLASQKNKKQESGQAKTPLAKKIKKFAKSEEGGFASVIKKFHKEIRSVRFFLFKDPNTKALNVIPILSLKNGDTVYLGREIMVSPQRFYGVLEKYSLPYKTSDSAKGLKGGGRSSYPAPVLDHPQMLSILMLKKSPENFFITLLLAYLVFTQLSAFSEKESGSFEVYRPEEIEGSFKSLVGLDDIKREVLQLKDIVEGRERYKKLGLDKTFNIMFSGPAGTGKTKMAMYLAKELGLPIITGTGNVETGYVGGGARTIKRLFNKARLLSAKHKGVVIFLDEAQTLFRARGERGSRKWEDDAANELLAQLDGVNSASGDETVIFIAASNFNDKNMNVDEAMARRFKKKIFFRYPSMKERRELFKLFLSKIDPSERSGRIDLDSLAKITVSHSPAKIETIVEEAALMAIREEKKVDENILMKAFERVNIGNTNRDLGKEHQRTRETVIFHELGHFICEFDYLMKKFGENLDLVEKESSLLKVSSEAISDFEGVLGYVLHSEQSGLKNIKEIREEIVQLYGGLASEEFFFGKEGITTGAHNDLEKIGSLLRILIEEMGLYGGGRFNHRSFGDGERLKNEGEAAKKLADALFSEAKKRVSRHEELILFLYHHLYERWTLSKKEIFELIKKFKDLKKAQTSNRHKAASLKKH